MRWTFAQLEHVSHACAQAFVAMGLRPGSKIVAYISNCAEFHVLFRAALELNCTFCPIVGSFFFPPPFFFGLFFTHA